MPETKKIKLGIIGCGKHCGAHLVALQELSHLYEITALCDIDPTRVETTVQTLANNSQIFQTTDYQKLIDNPNVEAIIIVTQTVTHLEIIEYAIQAQKPALTEKPLGINLEQVDKIIQLALTRGSLVMPALEYRHSAAFGNLYNYIQSNKMQGTQFISCSELRDNFFLPWFYDSRLSGGAVNDKLIHIIDLITILFSPSRPIGVYALGSQDRFKTGSKIEGLFEQEYDLDYNDTVDNAMIIIEFQDGKKANIAFNMTHQMPVEGMSITVTGTNGHYCKIDNLDTSDLIFSHNFDGVVGSYQLDNPDDIDINGILHPGTKRMYQLFAQMIDKEDKKACNWRQIRDAHSITMATKLSIEESRRVDIQSEFSNPKIENLLNELDKPVEVNYPEYPLIPIHTNSKKILRRNWLRILRHLPLAKRIKSEKNILRLNQDNISQLITILTQSSAYNLDKKQDLILQMNLPYSSIFINIQDGDIKITKHLLNSNTPKINFSLNESGYINFATGMSINRLYVTKQLQVSGDVQVAREYQHFFSDLLAEIRQLIKVQK